MTYIVSKCQTQLFPAVLQGSMDVPAPRSGTDIVIPTCFTRANVSLWVPEAVSTDIAIKRAPCP